MSQILKRGFHIRPFELPRKDYIEAGATRTSGFIPTRETMPIGFTARCRFASACLRAGIDCAIGFHLSL
ncbi:hypothetical protein GGD65_002528 [Bradyrhizobium sp. CIR18]|uniref:hypothetical protein n=1 Tax=Bradyrhizobium sp. CIR18 TaxID=2663839 RepID=UPI001605F736|nr:hypothetical protein [Bradyrhizobium sp. CIR18]MBB4361506.1 hypothetical protein [Bradyrhizobium sp. CIR18]